MSSLQAIPDGPSKLIVVCPPFYPAVLVMGLSLIVAGVITVIVVRMSGQKLPLGPVLVGLLPILLVLWALLSGGTIAVLNASKDDLSIYRRILGIRRDPQHYRLSTIRQAGTRTGRGTKQLVFVLNDGEIIPVGPYANQGGHTATASAINTFLSSQTTQQKQVR